MTTPDPTPAGQPSPPPADQGGAWSSVAKLLSLQLLTVVAITAVITGVYALAGGHDRPATAGGALPGSTSAAPSSSPSPSHKPTSKPSRTPSRSSPPTSSAPTTTSSTHALKVDVLNQSSPRGSGSKMAARVRSLGWKIGRVDNFNGNVSETTVYYPRGQAKAAHELADALPGNLRVLPRFSTLSGSRLTIILTG